MNALWCPGPTALALLLLAAHVANFIWLAVAGAAAKHPAAMAVVAALVYATPVLCAAMMALELVELRRAWRALAERVSMCQPHSDPPLLSGRGRGRPAGLMLCIALTLLAWLILLSAYVQMRIDLSMVQGRP